MKIVRGIGLVFLFAAAIGAQQRGGLVSPQPFVAGSFGNVLFPGGSSALPGIQRGFGNVVFPGGAGPRLVVPFSATDPRFLLARPGVAGARFGRGFGDGFGRRGGNVILAPYAVPVYVGGFYDNPYLGADGQPQQVAPPQPQPNITVVYPPLQQPMVMSPYPDAAGVAAAGPPAPETQPAAGPPAAPEPETYLIAFKDRTIYSAVAFWVDGDTLHYFTSGNMHNQASLSLVDKELTQRLNKELGIDLRLP